MKQFRLYILFAFLSMLCVPSSLWAQEFIEKITDFFEFDISKHDPLDTTRFVNKVVLAPVASYEPTTSLGFGVGAKLLFKFRGSGEETRTSNIPLSVQYTLKNQFIFWSGYTVFFNQEKWLLKGNLIYSKFPVSYYGNGSLSDESDKLEISSENLLIEPLLLKRVAPDLFIGGGIRYNTIYNTFLTEEKGELMEGTSLQDELGSTSVGIELAATYDSRDNVLNAATGNFLEFTHGFYDKMLGGTHRFMLSRLDFRQYFKMNPESEDILALHWYGRFAWDDAPPLEMSALGGPELLRGFQDDRFRDRVALFFQAEYRWQTFDRIGFVFFGGVGDVKEKVQELQISNLKYSLGTGLRLKIVKSENLNIRLDYAFGLGPVRDSNFYLGIAEAF